MKQHEAFFEQENKDEEDKNNRRDPANENQAFNEEFVVLAHASLTNN